MRHQNKPLLKALLITTLLLSVQKVALSHVGHGDEFQATGGIERVQVNAQTDSMLGIVVEPIEQVAPDGVGVMIPSSAVIDANDKQLVFVQYENFYEPVEVTTGVTQGDLIQVTKELSIGENLVTQGSLSLYAESRKTQTSEPPIVSEQTSTDEAHQKADAQGIPHSHDASGNLVENSQSETTPETDKSGMGILAPIGIGIVAAVGGGAALLIGAIAIMGGRKKKRIFSNKR